MGKVKTYLHICPSNWSNVKAIYYDSSRVARGRLLFTALGHSDVYEKNDLRPRESGVRCCSPAVNAGAVSVQPSSRA